jgi:hypothetical protein
MKKFSVFPLVVALAFFVSCQKQQTEEERKAEVERQVQDRLAAEKVEADKQRIAQQQAELDAREKALANRESASPTPVEQPVADEVINETSDDTARADTHTTAAYGMFYEKLDPYGEWRETKDYGYVWQPSEAETSRDWRPYTEGRWVYSDAGWTWVSDEKFGWATYHYGRWVRLRRVGWVWVPGREWAPAWVSWRTSKDYVGWAPLPPEARFDRKSGIQNWADSYYDIGPDQYAFVPSNEFGAEHVRRVVVPPERNLNIVIETTNVTRITFANTTIMNEGPSFEELRSRSQRPIERYKLRRERTADVQARVNGAELQVSVPLLSEVRNVFRPRRVKERVAEVNVDNGWTSVSDRAAAERARTKIRAESTPPPNAPVKKFVPPTETSATPAIAATAATSPSAAPAATPTATVARTSPSPTAAASPSAAPAATPTATIARTSPSPTAAPVATASTSPAASSPPPAATASVAPAAGSPTPKPKVYPTIRPRTKALLDAARQRNATPSPTPATQTDTTTPAPVASATPALPTINPTIRTRPSPSIPPQPLHTPVPIQRATPAPPADAAITPATSPPPAFTPPAKRPNLAPRAAPPTPTPAGTADTAQPPVPRDVPRHTPPRVVAPPVTTPAPTVATTPNVAPSVPPVPDERIRNRRPPGPVPGATEAGTPSPTPSAPPG